MRTMFQRTKETDKLIDLFQRLSIDTPVSFEDASKAAGFRITSSLPAYNSARLIAAKQYNIVIEGVRGFGFIRLTAANIVHRGGKHLKSIRRRARRAGHEMEVAISGNLDRDHMMKATEQLSRFRIIESTGQAVRAATNRAQVEMPEVLKPQEPGAAFR